MMRWGKLRGVIFLITLIEWSIILKQVEVYRLFSFTMNLLSECSFRPCAVRTRN